MSVHNFHIAHLTQDDSIQVNVSEGKPCLIQTGKIQRFSLQIPQISGLWHSKRNNKLRIKRWTV